MLPSEQARRWFDTDVPLFVVLVVAITAGRDSAGAYDEALHEPIHRINALGGVVGGYETYSHQQPAITLGHDWRGGNDGLASLRQMGAVYKLILDSPSIDDAGLQHLEGLRVFGGLQVKSTVITDVGLRHLKDARGLQLVIFDDGSHITDAGLEALKKHNLRWLLIGTKSQISDAGLAHLANMTNLLWLRLAGAKITGAGLSQLTKLTEMRELDLRDTQVGDDALATMPAFPKLRRLDLSGTKIHGPALAQLKRFPRLEVLTLDNTSLGDEDLQYLAGLDNLNVLSVEGTAVTPAGVHGLSMKNLRTVLLAGEQIEVTAPESAR